MSAPLPTEIPASSASHEALLRSAAAMMRSRHVLPSSLGAERKSKRAIEFLDADVLSRKLPPVQYLVEGLGIAPGAPVLLAGYGYSGKTMFAQALALSVATGKPFLGAYPIASPGPVVHFDFEQGQRLTVERYQRLAHGLGVESFLHPLKIAIHPVCRLDDPDAEQLYAEAIGNAKLVIIDSLKASAPGSDENSSDIRARIDLMGRLCERLGAVALFIHHAKKPKAGDPAGAKYGMRGSSAIFDAASSVFMLSALPHESPTVEHSKDRHRGKPVDEFAFRIDDLEHADDPKWGLVLTRQDVAPPATGTRSQVADMREHVLLYLRNAGGRFNGSTTALRQALGKRTGAVSSALRELLAEGVVEKGNDVLGPYIRLTRHGTAFVAEEDDF